MSSRHIYPRIFVIKTIFILNITREFHIYVEKTDEPIFIVVNHKNLLVVMLMSLIGKE